jgi:very-short-patch-repair endonuclease
VTLSQLLAAGLSLNAIGRRVAAGRLHRIYQRVYALGHRALSREGRWLAATFAAGDGAALSHLCAAALWDLRRIRTDFVDVVAPTRRRLKGPVRVHASRTLHPSDVTTRRGIPVTTVARMLVDLSDVLTPHQLANVIHEAAFRERFSVEATRKAMARANGRHHLGVLEAALAMNASGSAGTKSDLEDAFLRLEFAGVTTPRTNIHLLGEEVDCFWPERRLVVEVDGPGHRRPRTRREDAERDGMLRAAGVTVLRFTDDEIAQRPREVLDRLRAA